MDSGRETRLETPLPVDYLDGAIARTLLPSSEAFPPFSAETECQQETKELDGGTADTCARSPVVTVECC